ncbi:hypothetical protein OG884_05670 [Streptosporangium sp. NBC_01755]|uniref:hypothetical protein n=1 Tax=Streptosporangium sp. NBC_01755 TaxID=2975949 RepID=UPI002DD88E93|nr:hypothetical protein [Streptosporangium sp. NBC_01755]WSD01413.1 hypothetical protein OG884_05670 [Streptosporangium sp. NBC_01755]
MQIYVRFGDCPEGRSYNFDADDYEPGVSVYKAILNNWGELSLILPNEESAATVEMLLCDRPVYRVEGRLLETVGGDGEPLIADAVLTLMEDVDGTLLPYSIEENA